MIKPCKGAYFCAVEQELGPLAYLAFFIGGILAGIINTLAGNGSAITLSLLIFFGLPAGWANATNRVGVLLQTFTAVLSLRRTESRNRSFKDARFLIIPSLLGSALGAFLALRTGDAGLQYFIGGVMVLLLATMYIKPHRWKIATELNRDRGTPIMASMFFVIGLYAGYIQMGIGIMMLAVLVLYAKYSLPDANLIKLLLALIYILPAFLVFWLDGKIHWPSGIALAFGQSLGAWYAARHLLQNPKAGEWIRRLLIVVLVYAILRIFGFFDFIASYLL